MRREAPSVQARNAWALGCACRVAAQEARDAVERLEEMIE